MAMVVTGLGELLREQLGGGTAQLLAGLAHRGQGHGRRRRELDVVVADDGHVVGHPQVAQRQLLQHTQGDEIVGAEDGGGAVRW